MSKTSASTHDAADPRPNALGPLTDSPWFWAYLFGTAALVALLLVIPKYRTRQPQIERQFAARQSGGQAVQGTSGPVKPSTADEMIISIRPLFVVVGIVLMVAWAGLWYQRFRLSRHLENRRE